MSAGGCPVHRGQRWLILWGRSFRWCEKPTWVLRMKFGSTMKAVPALNQWATSPLPGNFVYQLCWSLSLPARFQRKVLFSPMLPFFSFHPASVGSHTWTFEILRSTRQNGEIVKTQHGYITVYTAGRNRSRSDGELPVPLPSLWALPCEPCTDKGCSKPLLTEDSENTDGPIQG